MSPDKLILLERINSVIEKNVCNKNLKSIDYLVANGYPKGAATEKKTYFYYNVENNELLKKLEQRILALEEQNDHLLYFIHFLFENFSDPGGNILKLDQEERSKQNDNGPPITGREREVLDLLVRGLRVKEIAQRLFICETTVITHKRHLKEKFKARNTAELISKAAAQ